MGARRQPAQDVFGADLGQGQGLDRAVQGGDDHQAVRRQHGRTGAQEIPRIGDMLDHFHIEDHIEGARPFRQQLLGRGGPIGDVQALFGGVG